jgi:hypothetical protein
MIRRWLGVFALTVLALAAGTAVAAEMFGYPPATALDEVRQRVDKAPAGHPRLLADKATLAGLRKAADSDPWAQMVAAAVVREAESLADAEPVQRQLQGRRLLGVSRRAVGRVLALAAAYHLTGDRRHAARCEREMLAAAEFSNWNPSHFLDVGEMTFALAIGYDWLFEQLTPEGRKQIRQAIVEKGVRLPWETRYNGWVRASNNWGQVCHGGMTAGALAVLEDEPDLAAKTVHSALQNLPCLWGSRAAALRPATDKWTSARSCSTATASAGHTTWAPKAITASSRGA